MPATRWRKTGGSRSISIPGAFCSGARNCDKQSVTNAGMRILAIDHGTVRMGIAVSDELKMLAAPVEFIPAEPFAKFLERLKELLREKEVELILVGMPRNMKGSYGP